MNKNINRKGNLNEKIYNEKEKISLWEWYFGWHPRLLLTVPVFLFFVYRVVWFVLGEINHVSLFFQSNNGSVFSLFMILLSPFLIMLFCAPISLGLLSIVWLYEIMTENIVLKNKIYYSIGLILLSVILPSFIRFILTLLL